ncbi:MAG: hypothetical protein LIV11_02455 [Bacillota bacterium]|nr:hypothetical protein [Bacillota bacterium]
MPKLLENGNLHWDAYEYDAMSQDELNILGHMNEDAQKQFVGMRLDEIKLFLRNRKAVMDSYVDGQTNPSKASKPDDVWLDEIKKEAQEIRRKRRKEKLTAICKKIMFVVGIFYPFIILIGCITQLQKLFSWLF